MSNRMMLGLLVSATVGLGAAAAMATEAPDKHPGGEQPQYTKKAALIIVDKDRKGQIEKYCKVPVKVRGDNLESDDPKAVIYKDHKKNFTVICKFKEPVKHPNPKKYEGIHKDGFLCKAVLYDHTFKTYYSRVDVTFEHREPKKDDYEYLARDNKGNYNKPVDAHVVLKCVFEKKHGPGPVKPY